MGTPVPLCQKRPTWKKDVAMEFVRSRRSILLDLKDREPTPIQIGTLLKECEASGVWDALVRVRKEHECNDVFLDGWHTESTSEGHIVLRQSVGIRPRIARV